MQEGKALVAKHFPEFNAQQLDLLEVYVKVLLETNKAINLISRKNEDEVWVNHILHSLSIVKVMKFLPGQQVLDFGTGGGLPGIPLAIAFPNTHFLLVDSIGKKVNAVKNMTEHLGLGNVKTKHIRVEEIEMKFDFAVSRAVTALPTIAGWLKGKLKKGHSAKLSNGLIYIKGGDFNEELKQINRAHKMWHMTEWFEDEFFETKKVVWIDLT